MGLSDSPAERPMAWTSSPPGPGSGTTQLRPVTPGRAVWPWTAAASASRWPGVRPGPPRAGGRTGASTVWCTPALCLGALKMSSGRGPSAGGGGLCRALNSQPAQGGAEAAVVLFEFSRCGRHAALHGKAQLFAGRNRLSVPAAEHVEGGGGGFRLRLADGRSDRVPLVRENHGAAIGTQSIGEGLPGNTVAAQPIGGRAEIERHGRVREPDQEMAGVQGGSGPGDLPESRGKKQPPGHMHKLIPSPA